MPAELSLAEARAMRQSDPKRLMALASKSVAIHVRAMLDFLDRGAIVFEYGNSLRAEAKAAGVEDAFRMRSFVDLYIRPLFCQGIGPFRWIAVSGDPQDISKIDDMILDAFSSNHPISSWIEKAREHVRFTGLPARIGWLGLGERSRLALLVNEAVAAGRLSGPVAFTRDHLDSGSAAMPHRETENMKDGSDAIADWPMLNALSELRVGGRPRRHPWSRRSRRQRGRHHCRRWRSERRPSGSSACWMAIPALAFCVMPTLVTTWRLSRRSDPDCRRRSR